MQRRFIDSVLAKIGAPSLRSLIERGFDVKYTTLKSYYQERRFLPLDFFNNLCLISRIDENNIDGMFELVGDSWGQKKGGERSRK